MLICYHMVWGATWGKRATGILPEAKQSAVCTIMYKCNFFQNCTLIHVITYVCINSYTNYWRASEVSETLSGVYKFELMRYVYIYIYMYGGMCAIIVAHATYT